MRRPNLQIVGIEGEEIQTKGIDNLFNRITAKYFLNLEKIEIHSGVGSIQNTKPSRTKQKQPPDIS
jgi:hypothetical protein